MRSAATFTALMATGVLIVMIYIWSGESMVALALSIVTLFAVLGTVQWQPWAIGQEQGATGPRPTLLKTGPPDPSAAADDPPCWRCRYDITWDERGISGVPLGATAPKMWSWTQIDDIGQDWCIADRDPGDEAESGRDRERLAFRLDFPDLRNREEPDGAWLMYGPGQHPDRVLVDARAAWRNSKMTRSRFYDLTAEERTRKLADHLAPDGVDIPTSMRSPELLYQEIRRALLRDGALCRLGAAARFEEVLDSFDRLLDVNGADPISRDEAAELEAVDGPDRVGSLHLTLDWIAEQRGFRLAFVDQGLAETRIGAVNQRSDGTHGQESSGGEIGDYLLGLIPANSADDWDGQTVGSGSARIVLDRPDAGA